ncbi:MAG: type II toxin-antitoxin system prevent-host-death family antitoxin [Alphaproteobacteria bacterium]|nr:type II toxin-antitoxin system prevent-host-death family antitoxin [Alphaproteobacteria bacterium]
MPEEVKVGIAEFKAKCARIVDDVEKRRIRVTVTRRGKPVARLVEIKPRKATSLYGAMAGTVTIHGDIVSPAEPDWNVLKD